MLDSSRAPIHGYCAKSGKLMRGWSLVSERRSATSATSFVLAVLITYREQWAQEQDQHQHREENQNIVVHIHLPLSANVSALFPPTLRSCALLLAKYFASLLGKNATGRSPPPLYISLFAYISGISNFYTRFKFHYSHKVYFI